MKKRKKEKISKKKNRKQIEKEKWYEKGGVLCAIFPQIYEIVQKYPILNIDNVSNNILSRWYCVPRSTIAASVDIKSYQAKV